MRVHLQPWMNVGQLRTLQKCALLHPSPPCNIVDVNEIVVGACSELGTIRGVLELLHALLGQGHFSHLLGQVVNLGHRHHRYSTTATLGMEPKHPLL